MTNLHWVIIMQVNRGITAVKSFRSLDLGRKIYVEKYYFEI